VTFCTTRIVGARNRGDTLKAVQVANAAGVVRDLTSDAYVMCLGSYSPQ
jgi:D-amino-acid dehydrogenase